MRINEYKRALNGVEDSDLELLQIKRLETSVVLEYPENPPSNWSHCTGSLKKSLHGQSVDRPSSDLASGPEARAPGRAAGKGREAGQAPVSVDLAPCRFLDGFISDMNETFGEQITRDCISAHYSGQGKPLTARVVKLIIASADKKLVEIGLAGNLQQTECRKNNDIIIAGFFKDNYWAGLLFPEADAERARDMRGNGRNLLMDDAARLVRKMTTALCRRLPEYSQGCLTETMLVSAARKVRTIHDSICSHPRSSELALRTAWSLLEQAFEEKGLDHVAKIWPAYMACAIAFAGIQPSQGSSVIRELAAEVGPHHDWSSHFLASIAPFYLEDFIADIDNKPWNERLPDTNWTVMFDDAMFLSRVRIHNILRTHLDLLFALTREEGLTEWQRRVITSELERAPRTLESFSALIELTESIGRGLVSLAQAREPACVFDAVTTISAAIAARISSFTEHDQLLVASLTAVAAGLSPVQARQLLEHMRDFDETTRQLIIKQDVPRTESAYRTLVSSLQQRATQASDDFQNRFLDSLRMDQARRTEMPPSFGTGLVSQKFMASILNSGIVLTSRDGDPVFDLRTLNQFSDEESRRDYVESVLFDVLASDPESPEAQKCLSVLTNTLYLMQNTVLRTCSETIFKDDQSGMLYFSDNTPVQKLDDDLDTCAHVTLIGIVDQDIHLSCSSRFSSIRSATDGGGKNCWLDPASSHLEIKAEIVLYPSGVIAFAMPLSCEAHLVRGRWPESRLYPQPLVRDLVGEVVVKGVSMADKNLVRKDLYAFAEAHKYERAMVALSALDAIRSFIDAPVDQEMDYAVRFYEEYIENGALDFLGNRETVGDVLQELLPRMDPTGVILAVNRFARCALDFADRAATTPPESQRAIDWLFELGRTAGAAGIAANRDAFDRLLQSLSVPGAPLSGYIERVPIDAFRDLVERLGQFTTPVDLLVFSVLENDLTDFLGRGLLPLFVDSVLSLSSSRNPST